MCATIHYFVRTDLLGFGFVLCPLPKGGKQKKGTLVIVGPEGGKGERDDFSSGVVAGYRRQIVSLVSPGVLPNDRTKSWKISEGETLFQHPAVSDLLVWDMSRMTRIEYLATTRTLTALVSSHRTIHQPFQRYYRTHMQGRGTSAIFKCTRLHVETEEAFLHLQLAEERDIFEDTAKWYNSPPAWLGDIEKVEVPSFSSKRKASALSPTQQPAPPTPVSATPSPPQKTKRRNVPSLSNKLDEDPHYVFRASIAELVASPGVIRTHVWPYMKAWMRTAKFHQRSLPKFLQQPGNPNWLANMHRRGKKKKKKNEAAGNYNGRVLC